MRFTFRLFFTFFAILQASQVLALTDIYNEVEDNAAPGGITTPQSMTFGSNNTSIGTWETAVSGQFTNIVTPDIDVYAITVTDFNDFQISIITDVGNFSKYGVIYVFDSNQFAVKAIWEHDGTDVITLNANGTYYVAVTQNRYNPISAGGQLWQTLGPTEEAPDVGPDAFAFQQWDVVNGAGAANQDYTLVMRGGNFENAGGPPAAPEPATTLLMLVGACAAVTRKKLRRFL